MPTISINNPTLVVQTAAQWATDATVYSNKRILVTSDVYYGSTDQRKIKIADGVQTWSNLDYFPLLDALAQYHLFVGNASGNPVDAGANLTYDADGLTSVLGVIAGDVGNEGSGIDISGVTYQSTFKVSDIDGSNYAQTLLHRHSTILEPLILGARSNSNTNSHADVTNSQHCFTIYAAGYAGSNYKLFGSISIGADSTGTISNTSAPGRMLFSITPNGSVVPVVFMTVSNDKKVTFAGEVTASTLTGTEVQPRTGTVASSATPTINTDNVDFFSITALAVDITSMTTNLSGTPTEGQTLWIAITGTAARAIAWGASFEASTVALPTTTVSTDRLDVGFIWNTVSNKWRCVGTC